MPLSQLTLGSYFTVTTQSVSGCSSTLWALLTTTQSVSGFRSNFGYFTVTTQNVSRCSSTLLYSISGFTSLPTASCYYLMHVHYTHQYMYPCLSICGVPKISLPTTVLSTLLMTAPVRPARRLTSSLICRLDS